MRLLQILRIPAAFIAANWAGLLGIVTVVGAVPGLAGAQKVMTSLDEHADTSGMVVLRHLRRTMWRDLPVTFALWLYLVLAISTTAVLTLVFTAPERVFFAGLCVPVYWIAGALLATYVRAAAVLPPAASRREVVEATAALVAAHPGRSLATVAVVLATAPVWVLAPLTIACGVSVPAWAVNALWARPRRARAARRVVAVST